jgi:tRNA (guanine-N7-)-methyltransferase
MADGNRGAFDDDDGDEDGTEDGGSHQSDADVGLAEADLDAVASSDSDTAHQRMPKVLPAILPGPVDWATVFGRTAPLECELGFGRPHFLLERAIEVPAHDIVGIEWKGRWPRVVHDKQAKTAAYPNVRALHGNAWLLFGALFAPSSLDLVVLNFPDPWWKSKHHKRRIVSDVFAGQIASRLKPGGHLLIQTDVATLLEEELARFEAQPTLDNTAGAGRLATKKPVEASSHREKRCRADGVPIFRAYLVRR